MLNSIDGVLMVGTAIAATAVMGLIQYENQMADLGGWFDGFCYSDWGYLVAVLAN